MKYPVSLIPYLFISLAFSAPQTIQHDTRSLYGCLELLDLFLLSLDLVVPLPQRILELEHTPGRAVSVIFLQLGDALPHVMHQRLSIKHNLLPFGYSSFGQTKLRGSVAKLLLQFKNTRVRQRREGFKNMRALRSHQIELHVIRSARRRQIVGSSQSETGPVLSDRPVGNFTTAA